MWENFILYGSSEIFACVEKVRVQKFYNFPVLGLVGKGSKIPNTDKELGKNRMMWRKYGH